MAAVRQIGPNGQITIPAELRQELGLGPGKAVEIEIFGVGLLIRPVKTDPEQTRIRTPQWQERERAADRAIVESTYTSYLSAKAFFDSLCED
jgi:AbrB family looped-hinge helix DNA binding protein